MADALYTLDGDRAVPAELTRGPWDPRAQHGGAPAALLAHLLEALPGGEEMRVVRMTIELLRPVPLTPLTWTARVARPGRRVGLLEAELLSEGQQVAIARAQRIRVEEGAVPAIPEPEDPDPPPGPDDGTLAPAAFDVERPWFGEDGVEIRFVRGTFNEMGPAAAWYRLRVPTVAGRPVTPLQRTAAAADFGNGASASLPWDRYVFINPDLTFYLGREPEGEWVGLDAHTAVDPAGIGLAQSVLRDERGPMGRALQSLYVAPR